MSVLDKIAEQIYTGNKGWLNHIVKYINDLLSEEKVVDKGIVYLYLDHGLTILDVRPDSIEQTFNMIQIVFATMGIIVERTHIIKGLKLYDTIQIDCRILFKNGKFESLNLTKNIESI